MLKFYQNIFGKTSNFSEDFDGGKFVKYGCYFHHFIGSLDVKGKFGNLEIPSR